MNKNHKGFASIILIIVVIALAGVLGYVTLVKKQVPSTEQPQPSSSNTQQPQTSQKDETQSWETYRNEKYAFEIKHPASYGDIANTIEDLQFRSEFSSYPPFCNKQDNAPDSTCYVKVAFVKTLANNPAELEKEKQFVDTNSTLTIDGIKWFVSDQEVRVSGTSIPTAYLARTYRTVKDKYVVEITGYYSISGNTDAVKQLVKAVNDALKNPSRFEDGKSKFKDYINNALKDAMTKNNIYYSGLHSFFDTFDVMAKSFRFVLNL